MRASRATGRRSSARSEADPVAFRQFGADVRLGGSGLGCVVPSGDGGGISESDVIGAGA